MAEKATPLYKLKRARLDEVEEIRKKVESIIGKAVVDGDFLEAVFKDPERVAKEFNLDQKGLAVIKQLKKPELEKFAKSFNARIMKDAAIIIFCG